MKFSIIPLLIAGASLAIQQAGASPINVVVVTETQPAPRVRFGHSAAPNLHPPPTAPVVDEYGRARMRRPCSAARLKDKAIEISNTFRKALGWPVIMTFPHSATSPPHDSDSEGLVRIMPFPPLGPDVPSSEIVRGDRFHYLPHAKEHHKHRHGYKHHPHHGSFLRRVHHALMALGPWEGRAVAFVLGCGIGVLLRMIWVITVVTYRMVKGETEEAPEYTLVCEHHAEEILVPPPQYVVEKVKEEKEDDVQRVA